MNEPYLRALAASFTVLAYVALCLAIWARQRKLRLAEARSAQAMAGVESPQSTPMLVLFASQTGNAEAIAWQTGRALHASGTSVRIMALNAVDAQTLQSATQALFVASTYGEGDAPDNASLFTETLMEKTGAPPDLTRLGYAMLALGDRQYAHFCGFAQALDDWLQTSGAVPMAPRIDVDNSDAAALAAWHSRWGGEAGEAGEGVGVALSAPATEAIFPPARWQLVSRELLNPGSAGAPVYQLGLRTSAEAVASWQSGDLARLILASDPGRPRDYSIASIPSDGELQLLVRQERHPDGRLGAASGLLTSTLTLGESVELQLRPHRNFRLESNAGRPLILIGNGTGLAGLRSHLRARAAAGQCANWLLFGERNAAHDRLCAAELDRWQRAGVLQRTDLVFSRDQPQRVYVQHRLLQHADEVQAWLARGAAVYVCGSLQGMAGGVDAALRQIAGDAAVRALVAEGRYRRDVY